MQKNSFIVITVFLVAMGSAIAIVSAGEIAYDSGGRRDPFIKLSLQPGAGAVVGGVGGHLQGIIYDPSKQSFAIFGGKTYKTGEKVGDVTIKKIQKDSVVLLVNGEEKTLRLREEEKNRPM